MQMVLAHFWYGLFIVIVGIKILKWLKPHFLQRHVVGEYISVFCRN